LGLQGPYPMDAIGMFSAGKDTLNGRNFGDFPSFHPVKMFLIDKNQNGLFDQHDYILFYGFKPYGFFVKGDSIIYFRNPYTDTSYFWLALGLNVPSFQGKLKDASFLSGI